MTTWHVDWAALLTLAGWALALLFGAGVFILGMARAALDDAWNGDEGRWIRGAHLRLESQLQQIEGQLYRLENRLDAMGEEKKP